MNQNQIVIDTNRIEYCTRFSRKQFPRTRFFAYAIAAYEIRSYAIEPKSKVNQMNHYGIEIANESKSHRLMPAYLPARLPEYCLNACDSRVRDSRVRDSSILYRNRLTV